MRLFLCLEKILNGDTNIRAKDIKNIKNYEYIYKNDLVKW